EGGRFPARPVPARRRAGAGAGQARRLRRGRQAQRQGARPPHSRGRPYHHVHAGVSVGIIRAGPRGAWARERTNMLTRRQFLTRSLQGASLLALAPAVPQFLANTARAAEAGKDTVLVVIELSGGNDGLNPVIPYGDDLYHKARPTLHLTKEQVVKVDDHIGLNPGMRSLEQLLQRGELAVVQGVGYPNPDRSHFESMDVWQSGDPKRKTRSGWIARGATDLTDKRGNVPIMQVGQKDLPLALQGAPGAVVSINDQRA